MTEFKAGDIVRYSDGCTALVKLQTPHAGGWHAQHCMGGTTFVSDRSCFIGLRPATPFELRTWVRCRKWRGETPARKPHLLRTEGGWQCYDARTSRVADTLQRAFDRHAVGVQFA